MHAGLILVCKMSQVERGRESSSRLVAIVQLIGIDHSTRAATSTLRILAQLKLPVIASEMVINAATRDKALLVGMLCHLGVCGPHNSLRSRC